MKKFIPFFFALFLLLPFTTKAQEVGFFREVSCKPTKAQVGHEFSVSFRRGIPYAKIFEFEEDEKTKKTKAESTDMFPAKVLEAHIFLSQKHCQFHVISRRPSVDFFHFVMNVEQLKSKDTSSYQGPAHFNFLIDEVYPMAKEHKLLNCSISGLKIPGYYFHSCKYKKATNKPTPRPDLPYYRDLPNQQQNNYPTGPSTDPGGNSGTQ